ncbi:MAG: bis(5'-nucleosyl)-tetraphosphatase (symmetrical) YqeK [Dehalococcoidia bacterium]
MAGTGKPLAKQLAAVQQEMRKRPAGLVAHVERVAAEADDLARRFDVDRLRVELGVWGHDLFRAYQSAELLRLAGEAGLVVGREDEAAPVMLHGPLAAHVLRERFAVTDEEALDAVRLHTTGLAEMPLIAKIILLADKCEPRKRARAQQLRDIRRLARRDLDLALLCWADWKWVEERQRGWASHSTHWLARQQWVREHHLDRALVGRSEEPESLALSEA